MRLLRGRVPEDETYAVATWGVVGGILGARLVHVVDRWDLYAEHPEQILAIWTGGIAIWGAIIGGVLAGYLVARRRAFPIGAGADAAAPGLALGMAIGRIGDIINGEHHAVACSGLPWCVGYTDPNTLGQPGPVHPAVAYEMLLDLVAVGVMVVLLRRAAGRIREGAIFWLWLLYYGVGRFLISFLRVGDPTSLLGLRQDQLISLAAVIVAIPVLTLLTVVPRRERLAA